MLVAIGLWRTPLSLGRVCVCTYLSICLCFSHVEISTKPTRKGTLFESWIRILRAFPPSVSGALERLASLLIDIYRLPVRKLCTYEKFECRIRILRAYHLKEQRGTQRRVLSIFMRIYFHANLFSRVSISTRIFTWNQRKFFEAPFYHKKSFS